MIESLEIQVNGQKMDDGMKYFAFQTAYEAIVKKHLENRRQAETFIKNKFNEKYGKSWICLDGRLVRLAMNQIEYYINILIRGENFTCYRTYNH